MAEKKSSSDKTPKKPNLPIYSGTDLVVTENGTTLNTTTSAAPPKQTFFDRIIDYVGKGGAVAALIVGTLVSAGIFIGTTQSDIREMKEDIAELKGIRASSSEVTGLTGIMGSNVKGKRTSYGFFYDTSKPICEWNESSSRWKDLPQKGQFVELTNIDTELSASCMIVGTISDATNGNRMLVVSKPVVANLGQSGAGLMNVKIKLISESDTRRSKANLDLRKSIYELKESQ
jgi:hypothetical protein